MKRKSLVILIILTFIMLPIKTVYAAGLSISASSTTVVLGNTVRVTVGANGIAGRFSVTSSNGGVLSGGTGSEWLENESKTYTFSAKSLGSATISFNPINAAYSDGSGKVTSGRSITINVVKPREKSNNNNLKSLSIEGVEITPGFNKDTLEYSAEVGDEVEAIKINAVMEDGYGHVEGAGDRELAEGLNKFEIKAISETGLEKVYILNVTVKDNNPIEKTIDGKKYTMVKRASSLVLPEGLNKEEFVLNKVMIENDIEIPYYFNEKTNQGLAGLKDENGVVYLFKLDGGVITEKYELLTSKGLNIEFTSAKNIPDGYTKTEVTIDDKLYTAYQNKYKNYALIYGKNLETGEEEWYSYNIKEKSIQKYNSEMVDDLNKQLESEKNKSQILFISIIGVSVLFLLILIIEIVFNNKNKKQLRKIVNTKSNTIESEKQEESKSEDVTETKKSKKNKEVIKKEKVIAEKVEETGKEKKKQKKEEIKDDIPNIDEIVEDLKPIENMNDTTNSEDEKLKEIEEFYGKVRKGKKIKL